MENHWPIGRATLQKLAKKKYRKQAGLYLLEGVASVWDAARLGAGILGVVHDSRAGKQKAAGELLAELRRRGIPLQEVGEADLKRISGLTTPPPVIAVLREEEEPAGEEVAEGLTLALDRVGDPGNVGTLLRAAAFYGLREVRLGEGCAERYNPKVLRAAMSAHLHLRIAAHVALPEWVRRAREQGAVVFAATVDGGEEPRPLPAGGRAVLLLGSEPHGLSGELVSLADIRLAIPRRGPIDSLNVAMAGVVLLDRLLRP